MAAGTHQLSRLMQWYHAHYDDEWEHRHGIKLEPLEPAGERAGWSLIVDTHGTEMADVATAKQRIERSETNWLQWSFEPGSFRGSGGPRCVNELIGKFFEEIERLAERQRRA